MVSLVPAELLPIDLIIANGGRYRVVQPQARTTQFELRKPHCFLAMVSALRGVLALPQP
jgi:hypothetical protein